MLQPLICPLDWYKLYFRGLNGFMKRLRKCVTAIASENPIAMCLKFFFLADPLLLFFGARYNFKSVVHKLVCNLLLRKKNPLFQVITGDDMSLNNNHTSVLLS